MRRRRASAIFRLRDHTRRLFDSAKIYRIDIPYTPEQINAACKEIIVANGLNRGAYLRPFAFRGYGEIGVAPKIPPPIETVIAAFEWGAYLGAEGLENGIDVCVSSWQRLAPNTIPTLGKAAGNYLSSQLISMEAKRLGFAEGIGLGVDGTVSEGAGENLFLIRDGVIYTPALANSILQGITRDTVMTLARAHGFEVREQAIPRELLYLADEIFLTGTAAEITPVRSVDHITDRRRQARPDHRSAAGGVLRPVQRQDRRTSGAGWSPASAGASARRRCRPAEGSRAAMPR